MFVGWVSIDFTILGYECKGGLMNGCVRNFTVSSLCLPNSISPALSCDTIILAATTFTEVAERQGEIGGAWESTCSGWSWSLGWVNASISVWAVNGAGFLEGGWRFWDHQEQVKHGSAWKKRWASSPLEQWEIGMPACLWPVSCLFCSAQETSGKVSIDGAYPACPLWKSIYCVLAFTKSSNVHNLSFSKSFFVFSNNLPKEKIKKIWSPLSLIITALLHLIFYTLGGAHVTYRRTALA